MRAAIGWSHDLLSPEQQMLFRRLAVFVGGFNLEAAEHVVGLETDVLLEGIASLTDESLLRQIEQHGDEPRYSMLETVREYGLEQLASQWR